MARFHVAIILVPFNQFNWNLVHLVGPGRSQKIRNGEQRVYANTRSENGRVRVPGRVQGRKSSGMLIRVRMDH